MFSCLEKEIIKLLELCDLNDSVHEEHVTTLEFAKMMYERVKQCFQQIPSMRKEMTTTINESRYVDYIYTYIMQRTNTSLYDSTGWNHIFIR